MTRSDAWKGHLHIEAVGDRHKGSALTWSAKKLDDWAKDHDLIMAAFLTAIEEKILTVGWELRHADGNEDNFSLGEFILDLTTNGHHIGETDYDEYAVALHTILRSASEIWNEGREGISDREIDMALCPSVYDYASCAFYEKGIENPWRDPEDDEMMDY